MPSALFPMGKTGCPNWSGEGGGYVGGGGGPALHVTTLSLNGKLDGSPGNGW